MEVVPIEIFGVLVDVPFPSPLGLGAARLDDFAARLCDPQKGLSIRSEQVRLKKWDELFGYELVANFFGENGQVTRTADRVKLFVRNARTAGDWNVIQQTLTKFFTLLSPDEKTVSTLSTHAHGKFSSVRDRDSWLNQFSHTALLSKAGALGYVRTFDWDRDIRVLIEPSNLVPDAVFIAWDTQFANNQPDWAEFISSLPMMMENAANLFELGFEPFKERV